MLEYKRTWTFTSTGASAWEDAYLANQHTFNIETAAGSTATVQIESRRSGSTVSAVVGASVNMGASSMVPLMVSGAYDQVRAHVTDMTSTGTVIVQGFGNS